MVPNGRVLVALSRTAEKRRRAFQWGDEAAILFKFVLESVLMRTQSVDEVIQHTLLHPQCSSRYDTVSKVSA